MIKAHQKDEALLQDIEIAEREAPEQLHIWWLGQSGFLASAGGVRILFDPYLSDSLTRKYAGTDKEHIRMSEQVVEPEQLRGISVVTSTHNHTDHLDAETLNPLREANPDMRLVIPEANRDFVKDRLGMEGAEEWQLVGMDEGVGAEIGEVKVTGFPAAHDLIDRDAEGRCKYLGYLFQWKDWTVFHSGDTRPIPGMGERLRPFQIDVALLPINGALEERRVSGNLWGQEAAALAAQAQVRWVIPCHYDLFTFNTETPAAFIEACERREGLHYQVLKGGQRFSLKP